MQALLAPRMIVSAYLSFWKKSFDFKSKTPRSDFWWAIAGNIVAMALIYFVGFLLSVVSAEPTLSMSVLSAVFYFFLSMVPSLSIQVRRLRDIGQSPYLLLVSFVPVIGLVWQFALIYLYTKPSSSITA